MDRHPEEEIDGMGDKTSQRDSQVNVKKSVEKIPTKQAEVVF